MDIHGAGPAPVGSTASGAPTERLGPRGRRGSRTTGTVLSGARARVLDLLRDQPEPLSLAALTRATGLHENTLREHLDGLVGSGLAERHRSTPRGRGRPAWLYAASEEDGVSEYAGLATALAAGLAATAEDPAAAGAEAGQRWGGEIARQRTPAEVTDARAETLLVLEEFGFSPREGDGDDVDLTRCPLLEAAHQHPDVVCAVHLGLVRGVLSEYGADPAGTSLTPFASPGACHLVIPRPGRP